LRAECDTVADVLKKLEETSIIGALVASAGLEKEASDVNAEITVFAPSDSAVTNFSSVNVPSTYKPNTEDTGKIKKVCALLLFLAGRLVFRLRIPLWCSSRAAMSRMRQPV
jgi:hypothetical protein